MSIEKELRYYKHLQKLGIKSVSCKINQLERELKNYE